MNNNWIEVYPMIVMISLTSGLLLLCSFARRKPKPKTKAQSIDRSASTSTVASINLLTNEDSAKVYRHGTTGSKSLSKSGHSLSAVEVAIKIEEEPEKPKVTSNETVPEKLPTKPSPKPMPVVEKKKSKTQVKESKSQPSLELKDKEDSGMSIKKTVSTSSINSIRSLHSIRSVISAIDSEPEISTIRTIYKSKTKKPVKSIISHNDSDERSKSTDDLFKEKL